MRRRVSLPDSRSTPQSHPSSCPTPLTVFFHGLDDNPCCWPLTPMPRRLSASAEDTGSIDPFNAASPAPSKHGKKRSFTSAKYDVTRHSETLDRRKIERTFGLPGPLLDGSNSQHDHGKGLPKRQPLLTSEPDLNRMPESRDWRRSRARYPWACSLLTVSVTFSAFAILLFIVHAFITRQLDAKGCDMCWSRPIYFKFSDFDTEHTRFASKYHLYLYREGGFDEDPKV